MKLTKTRLNALKWFRDNDHQIFWPIGITVKMVQSLEAGGLLHGKRPASGFGMIVYSITDAGRAALAQEDGK